MFYSLYKLLEQSIFTMQIKLLQQTQRWANQKLSESKGQTDYNDKSQDIRELDHAIAQRYCEI